MVKSRTHGLEWRRLYGAADSRRDFAPEPEAVSESSGDSTSHPPSLRDIDGMTTLCQPTPPTPKAEKILKTKGRNMAFSPDKAENILKQSQLQETV